MASRKPSGGAGHAATRGASGRAGHKTRQRTAHPYRDQGMPGLAGHGRVDQDDRGVQPGLEQPTGVDQGQIQAGGVPGRPQHLLRGADQLRPVAGEGLLERVPDLPGGDQLVHPLGAGQLRLRRRSRHLRQQQTTTSGST